MADAINFLKDAVLSGERKVKSYAKPVKRSVYGQLTQKPRMHILYGMRGSGKTTLLFQRFTDYPKGRRVYLNGDEIGLLSLSLSDIFNNLKYVIDLQGGAVFLDEITRVSSWGEQLKAAYDGYPELAIYVSGSSAVELAESRSMLARRAKYSVVSPMTFREFLMIAYGIELRKYDLNARDIYTESMKYDLYFKDAIKKNPRELVSEYARKSQPFMLEADEDMLMDLMDKVIYGDIAKAYPFQKEVLNSMHRLLLILSMSEKTTYENLSKDLKLSKGAVGEMIRALANSGIIRAVLPYGSGRIAGRKTWRYFFTVPAVRMMYMKKGGAEQSLITGLVREDLFISHLENVFYLPSGPDFVYNNMVFEVGGTSKDIGQLNSIHLKMPKFIVYDSLDIEKENGVLKIPFYMFLSHL